MGGIQGVGIRQHSARGICCSQKDIFIKKKGRVGLASVCSLKLRLVVLWALCWFQSCCCVLQRKGERSRDSPLSLRPDLQPAFGGKSQNPLSCAPALELFPRTKYLVWFHSLDISIKLILISPAEWIKTFSVILHVKIPVKGHLPSFVLLGKLQF